MHWAALLGLAALVGDDGATLTGIVTVAGSGEPLAAVTVTLTDAGRSTTSGDDGRYALRDVPAGLQHVSVRRLGHATRTLHVFVPASGTVELNVALAPLPAMLRPVRVASSIAVRGSDAAAERPPPGELWLSAAAMRNHPTLAEPDALGALGGGGVLLDAESPRGLHVRGAAMGQVAFVLDGVPILEPYHTGGAFSAWSPDALERVRLQPTAPAILTPDALSGVVAAESRRPGERVHASGAASTTQARLAVDGPLPVGGARFLVGARRGFAGYPAPDREPSYVHGASGDWIAKLEDSVASGALRLLAYESGDEMRTASRVAGDSAGVALPGDNRFRWASRSRGGEWSRDDGARRLRVRAWHAAADASARWAGDTTTVLHLASRRRDFGGAMSMEVGDTMAATSLGVRLSRSRTTYEVAPADTSIGASHDARGTTGVIALSLAHRRALPGAVRVSGAAIAARYGEHARLAPRVEIGWTASPSLEVAASVGRAYQPDQSLANGESVVGYVFPATLATTHVARPARSDQATVVARARPWAGAQVTAEWWRRDFDDVVLVAPSTAQPFAVGEPAVGHGRAHGATLDVALSRARWAMVAAYGLTDVRHTAGDTTWVPAFAARHAIEAGMLLQPLPSTSLRLSWHSVLERRSTPVVGPFEWEACNVLDRGCEFAGSPSGRDAPLGSVRAPAYHRLDAGVRHHRHVRLGDTHAEVGVYATVTNVLDRRNVLTRASDPESGESRWITMRSRAPLVVGLDWRF